MCSGLRMPVCTVCMCNNFVHVDHWSSNTVDTLPLLPDDNTGIMTD